MRKPLSSFAHSRGLCCSRRWRPRPHRAASAQEPLRSILARCNLGSTTAECIVEQAVDPYNALGNGTQSTRRYRPTTGRPRRPRWPVGPVPISSARPDHRSPCSWRWRAGLSHWMITRNSLAGTTGSPRVARPRQGGWPLYSIPDEIETLVLYYNKTLFEQNGWEPPTTLDELMALAEQINAAGIVPFANANAEWRPANEWFVGEFLNHSAGGPQKVYDALTGGMHWTDPDFVAAIEALNQMQQNGWFSGGLDRYYTATDAETGAMFGAGEAAMKIEGTWFLAECRRVLR